MQISCEHFAMSSFPKKLCADAPVLHVLYAWYYYLTSKEFAFHMDCDLE